MAQLATGIQRDLAAGSFLPGPTLEVFLDPLRDLDKTAAGIGVSLNLDGGPYIFTPPPQSPNPPVNPDDVPNKQYVDDLINGLSWKDACRVLENAINVNIAAPGAAIDGIGMVVGDRVLLNAQAAPAQNGIWEWNGAAVPMTRPLDFATGSDPSSAATFAQEGTNADTAWTQTADGIVIDTGAQTWVQFSSAGLDTNMMNTDLTSTGVRVHQLNGNQWTMQDNVVLANSSYMDIAGTTFTIKGGDGANSGAVVHSLTGLDLQILGTGDLSLNGDPGTLDDDLISLGNNVAPIWRTNNFAGIAAPTVNDDAANTSGNGVFRLGSRWIDIVLGLTYECVDPTATAAIWVLTTSVASQHIAVASITLVAGDIAAGAVNHGVAPTILADCWVESRGGAMNHHLDGEATFTALQIQWAPGVPGDGTMGGDLIAGDILNFHWV